MHLQLLEKLYYNEIFFSHVWGLLENFQQDHLPKSSYQLWLALAFGFLAVDYHRIDRVKVADAIQDVSLWVDEDARELVSKNALRSEISQSITSQFF